MFDIERSVADCRTGLKERSPQSAIKEIVAQAMSNPGEVEKALGTPYEAKLVTLHQAADLTVLNLIWAPGMSIYPHDHRMWAVIGLSGGREDNLFYRRTAQGLVHTGGKCLEITDTTLLGESMIHAVKNPLSQFTGAIHAYGGDFFGVPRSEFDPDTFEERRYDAEKAKHLFREPNGRLRAQPGS